ncbi:MAG: glycosyltransferase [Lachnospiraceae bacterium]|nr:glycosyltransferase [Lachnospiraceae bacterium]
MNISFLHRNIRRRQRRITFCGLREFKPDLIHVVTEFTIGNEGLRIARETGIPLVTSFHTNIDQYLQYFHAKLLEKPVKAYFKNFHSQALLTLCPSGRPINS